MRTRVKAGAELAMTRDLNQESQSPDAGQE